MIRFTDASQANPVTVVVEQILTRADGGAAVQTRFRAIAIMASDEHPEPAIDFAGICVPDSMPG